MSLKMHDEHPKIRRQIVYTSIIVVLLFATGETSYTIPQINITIRGGILWPLLAIAQIFIVVKGHLTTAITGVIMPWTVARDEHFKDDNVFKMPEYWYIFFNQAIPIASYLISFIIIAVQHYRIFIAC